MTTVEHSRRTVEEEIKETLGIVPGFFQSMPDALLEHEWTIFKYFELSDQTYIPPKYKQLMAIGIHSETKCRYCTLFHQEIARMLGATEQEIEEAVHFAKHTVGLSVYLNGSRYPEDKFAGELDQMIEHLSDQPRPM